MVLSAAGNVANAEVIADDNATTNALVGITGVSDDDIPNIIDPDGNDNGGNTGHAGQFTIDAVPNFDFGSTSISGDTITLEKTTKSAIQVSDRRSVGSGWKLDVKLGDFNNVDSTKTGKEAKLKGVSMKLVIIGDLVPELGNTNIAPDTTPIEISSGGSSATLMSAASDTEDVTGIGRGSWMGRFSDGIAETKTSLFVPGGNYEGQYSADLVWTLSQTL